MCYMLKKLTKEDLRSNFKMYIPHLQTNMELDVYIPSLCLAIEYQGKQHYEPNNSFMADSTRIQKDQNKRNICDELGITLVEIPYWWNQSEDALIMAIQKHRPDIKLDVSVVHKKNSTSLESESI